MDFSCKSGKMSGPQTSHRSGLLKQSNKTHKHGRHRSKSEIDKNNKGTQHDCCVLVVNLPKVHHHFRTSSGEGSSQKNDNLKRGEQIHKADQMRSKKREQIIAKKHSLGGTNTAPFLTAIIPLGQSKNVSGFLNHVKRCDEDAKIQVPGRDILRIR